MTDAAPAVSAAGFPERDLEAWRALAETALKGGAFDRLTRTTPDGVARGPLHTRDDRPDADPRALAPGMAAARDRYTPWDLRTPIAHPAPAEAAKQAVEDLEGGATSLALSLDPDGGRGVVVRAAADLDRALDDVLLDLAGVALDAGRDQEPAATALAHVWAQRAIPEDQRKGELGLDPLALLVTQTDLGRDLGDAWDGAAWWTGWAADHAPKAFPLRIDASLVAECGATPAWSIAWAAACGAATFRALLERDVEPDVVALALAIRVVVDSDVHQSFAALRALRFVWTRVATAFEAAPETARAHVSAVTARAMLSAGDPWLNMLRTTAAGFAAAVGGADAITLSPFTDALGLPTALARRVARNAQHLLAMESHLGRVADPAAGSFHHDRMTMDLAQAAWSRFQTIEKAGGAARFVTEGFLRDQILTARANRWARIAKRKDPLVGVSEFAPLDLDPVETDAVDLEPLLREVSDAAPLEPHKPAELLNRAGAGDVLLGVGWKRYRDSEPEPYHEANVRPVRWAEPFERLKAAASAHKPTPTVFLAALGPLSAYGARATWTANLLAAGGLRASGADHAEPKTVDALLTDAGGAKLAILVGDDAAYAEHAAGAAAALSSAGVTVWLAGRPGEREEALRAAGVSRFLFAGGDALDDLAGAHHVLEIPS